jgi:hypothetical protein
MKIAIIIFNDLPYDEFIKLKGPYGQYLFIES